MKTNPEILTVIDFTQWVLAQLTWAAMERDMITFEYVLSSLPLYSLYLDSEHGLYHQSDCDTGMYYDWRMGTGSDTNSNLGSEEVK